MKAAGYVQCDQSARSRGFVASTWKLLKQIISGLDNYQPTSPQNYLERMFGNPNTNLHLEGGRN